MFFFSSGTFDDAVVLVMVADPKPLHSVIFVNAKRAIAESDAYGPQLADLLEMQRRM